jgi:hypothetical protein
MPEQQNPPRLSTMRLRGVIRSPALRLRASAGSVPGAGRSHTRKSSSAGGATSLTRKAMAPGISRAAKWLLSQTDSTQREECIDWPFGVMKEGYGRLDFRGREYLAHRLICEWAHGPVPEDKEQAAHSCGNRLCVNPHHLRWATRRENEADKVIHGTTNRGARSGSAVLTPDDVRRIRSAVKSGVTMYVLSKQYGVAHKTIKRAALGLSWSEVM